MNEALPRDAPAIENEVQLCDSTCRESARQRRDPSRFERVDIVSRDDGDRARLQSREQRLGIRRCCSDVASRSFASGSDLM